MTVPRAVAAVGVGVCLVWAGVEARHLGAGQQRPVWETGNAPSAGAVEASFAAVLRAQDSGRREDALLELRERAARGPHSGYARFLLGELAFEEGAYPTAVSHYRAAVEAEPYVGDRASAFSSARVIDQRLDWLRGGPWRKDPPPEIRDLYYLKRRLAGGCE